MGWTWENGTPRERAEMVRSTLRRCLGNREAMLDLFNLSETGLRRILAGEDWKPEYEKSDNRMLTGRQQP